MSEEQANTKERKRYTVYLLGKDPHSPKYCFDDVDKPETIVATYNRYYQVVVEYEGKPIYVHNESRSKLAFIIVIS